MGRKPKDHNAVSVVKTPEDKIAKYMAKIQKEMAKQAKKDSCNSSVRIVVENKAKQELLKKIDALGSEIKAIRKLAKKI